MRIRSYPLQEYLGLIFAYLGDAERGDTGAFRPAVAALSRLRAARASLQAVPPEHWPCNYFNRLDNDADAAHVLFTHAESTTPRRYAAEPRGAPRVGRIDRVRRRAMALGARPSEDFLHCHMPPTNQIRVKIWRGQRPDEPGASVGRIADLGGANRRRHSLRFEINLVHLSGEAAEAHRQRSARSRRRCGRRASGAIRSWPGSSPSADLGATSMYQMFRIEDYVTQVGQGRIADRALDRLGTQGRGVVLRRKLWQRELAALEQGGR